jgi:Ran GTPase-activating protein (RanGAP) involved in mRNA processing and transport
MARFGLLDAAAQALAEVLKQNNDVLKVDVSDNHLTDKGAHVLMRALRRNRGLQELDFSGNELDDKFCTEFATFIKLHGTLHRMTAGSGIDCKGCQVISAALTHNRSLVEVDLSGNKIKDAGAIALFRVMQHNPNLKLIALSGNILHDEAMEAVAQLLYSNQSIEVIKVDQNHGVTNDGAGQVINALLENGLNRIQKFHIERTSCSQETLELMVEAIHAKWDPKSRPADETPATRKANEDAAFEDQLEEMRLSQQ